MSDTELYWLNSPIDDGLDSIPEVVHERITDIMAAFIDRGRTPSQELIVAALSRLSDEPVAIEVVEAVLIAHWRSLLDEVDWLDPMALQAHLDQAPVKEHPLCYYIAGMIRTLSFTQWWYARSTGGQPLQWNQPAQDGGQGISLPTDFADGSRWVAD